MPENGAGRAPILGELHAIRGVLEDLLIIECARTGMTRDELRRIVPVDKTRISRLMKHARKAAKGQGQHGDNAA